MPDNPTFSVAQLAHIDKALALTTIAVEADTAAKILAAHADPVVRVAIGKLMPVLAEWSTWMKPTFEREVAQVEAVLIGEPGDAFYVGNSGTEDMGLPGEKLRGNAAHISFELGDTGWLMRAAAIVLVNGDETTDVEVVDGDVVRVGWTEITVRIPGGE